MRFWVAVARNESESDDRLKRTAPEDRIAVYAPRPKQSFTRIIDIDANVLATGEAAVKPLIESLDFVRDKQQWGVFFRRGFFEISEKDFRTIESAMAG
jgi:limonene-1,2-epoxide hydrolase